MHRRSSRVERIVVGSLLATVCFGCANMNSTQKGRRLVPRRRGPGSHRREAAWEHGGRAVVGALAGTAGGALAGNAKDEADRRDNYARQATYERNLRVREQRAMTNRDVIEMSHAGVSDRTIVRTIKDRGGAFDTSPQGIITLQRYGVSDTLIEAMQSNNSY